MWGVRLALPIQGMWPMLRITSVVILTAWICFAGLPGLLEPIKNGCIMTYMYPTYIPISSKGNAPFRKYGLYLYHEGWKTIDSKEHLMKLSGVPVLFIPGNAGSYKQVRSLAAESDRAYEKGPFERSFYHEASPLSEERANISLGDYNLPHQYTNRLDWFTVDLESEHSAMDGHVLEDQSEYVVYAIHTILDLYKDSHGIINIPQSVILVGHSMGGFVARAAAIHPRLRKSAVQTILTLSSPHQSPPLALQPSLGHYFARVNQEWKKGYEVQTAQGGKSVSEPLLSRMVVVSFSGGYNDYQVRSKLESLEGIVPQTHGFMISSTSMNHVWLSMGHQAILWCNHFVVQVSHTILSLVDSNTSQPIVDTQKRLWIFTRMLQSAVSELSHEIPKLPSKSVKAHMSTCPVDTRDDDLVKRDLYIQTNTVTILDMDGRRRWMDIKLLGSNGTNHFIFVTNLAPCSGVRLHLWPEKGKSNSDSPLYQKALDVTSKLVMIPSGTAPTQSEPGSQTEQAPPTSVMMIGPEDMHAFRFLTISVSPRPQRVSGKPPLAVSMAVGQFFNLEAAMEVSSPSMLLSTFWPKELYMKEDHPLAYNLSFGTSLGLLPITLSLKSTGCGLRDTHLPDGDSRDLDKEKLCKMRCFPPVALAWDSATGLHVFPNLYSETIVVDSSPLLWSSSHTSHKTTVILLVDPHCSYTASIHVSAYAAASRFLLLYGHQIAGFSFSVIFFAQMRQIHEWNSKKLFIPSFLSAIDSNLRTPLPLLLLVALPILSSLFFSFLMAQQFPPIISFIAVSLISYLFANGFIVLLVFISKSIFQITAFIETSIKSRFRINHWLMSQNWLSKTTSGFVCLKINTTYVSTMVAITLVFFVHPALGLFIIVISHAFCCHNSMSCMKMALRRKDSILYDQNLLPVKNPSSSLDPTQAEIFNHRHGLLILHLLSMLMFFPSLPSWFQRIGTRQNFPWLADSVISAGVILHGTLNRTPAESSLLFSLPPLHCLIYLAAGYYSFISGLTLATHTVLYAVAAVGYVLLLLKIFVSSSSRLRLSVYATTHSHRH